MAIYSAYLPPVQNGNVLQHVRFVSDAKAPWALVFPPFWLIWHRLWIELMAYAVIALAIGMLLIWIPVAPVLYLSAIPGFYLLLEGNELIRRKLERAGWIYEGVIEASGEEEAEIRFIVENQDSFVARENSQLLKAKNSIAVHPVSVGLFPE